MRVSELSERAGVPLATIKFYIREGLLPAGQSTGRNQAEYSADHLERLTLIRALRDDACLSVAAIARALRAADSAKDEFVRAAIDAIERPAGPEVDESSAVFKQAKSSLMKLCKERGWRVLGTDLATRDAARAIVVILRSFPDEEDFTPYAEAAERIAEYELPPDWEDSDTPMTALRYAMLGTVLFEPLLLALRRMAHNARGRGSSFEAPFPRPSVPKRVTPAAVIAARARETKLADSSAPARPKARKPKAR